MLPDYCKKCFCYDVEDEDCGAAYEYPEDGEKCIHRKCHYCYYYQKIDKKHKCIILFLVKDEDFIWVLINNTQHYADNILKNAQFAKIIYQ